MRQLAAFPESGDAHTLADYLRSLEIETRIDQSASGWVVWVRDEDDVPRARQELAEFLKEPTHERYHQAASAARQRRNRKQEAEEHARRRAQERLEARRLAPNRQVTVMFIALSVVVSVAFWTPKNEEDIRRDFFVTVVIRDGDKIYWREGLPEIRSGEVWRLVTPILVHFSAWHLLFNMIWLWDLGGQIERRYGAWRILLLIVSIAAISNLAQYFLSRPALDGFALVRGQPNPNFCGMSGVVFGLFGYIWLKTHHEPNCGLILMPTTVFLMIAWLIVCMTGLVGPIANTAHLTGLVTGSLAGAISAWRANRRKSQEAANEQGESGA